MNLFNGFHSINKRMAAGASGASGVLGGNTTTAYCSISGLRAWYDANSPTTYSLSSNLLQTWGDKSGWGTHMTRWGNTGTTSNAPYSGTGLNGAAGFTFSGVSNNGAAGHNSLSAGTNCALNQFPNGI